MGKPNIAFVGKRLEERAHNNKEPQKGESLGTTIALVSNTSWSMYNFRRGLIRHLRDAGYRVVVVAPQDNFSAALVSEGVEFMPFQVSHRGVGPVDEWRTFWQLYHIYRKIRPNLIFHYTIKPNIYGSLAAALLGIPSVAVITGLGHTFSSKVLTPVVVPLYRWAMRYARKIIFLNDHDMQVFVNRRIGSVSRMMLMPGEGVDTNYFFQSNKRVIHPVRFLFAGRLLRDKGVVEFAEAARLVNKWYETNRPDQAPPRFRMLGFLDQYNGNAVSSKDILQWQQEGIVEYMGETTDIRSFIDTSDCLVLPTYYGEGLSRVLLEAASMGKPLITTRHVGCAELVTVSGEKRNGYLCDPKNEEDLASVLIQMSVQTPAEIAQMGKNSRNLILEKYEEKIILRIYETVLRQILG